MSYPEHVVNAMAFEYRGGGFTNIDVIQIATCPTEEYAGEICFTLTSNPAWRPITETWTFLPGQRGYSIV